MFKAATGEGGGEEAAAASADLEWPEKVTPASVKRLYKTAEKLQKNPLTGKSVGVKTHTSPTGAVEMNSAVTS